MKKRRDQIKFPGFDKKYTTRIRQEKIDFDYIESLPEDAKEFLHKFIEEEINSKFANDGTDFNKSKEDRKKIYDRNNQANRDLYSNLKNKDNKFQNKKLVNFDSESNTIENELGQDTDQNTLENTYVEFLEHKQMEELEKYARELDELEDHAEYLDSIETLENPSQPQPSTPESPELSEHSSPPESKDEPSERDP